MELKSDSRVILTSFVTRNEFAMTKNGIIFFFLSAHSSVCFLSSDVATDSRAIRVASFWYLKCLRSLKNPGVKKYEMSKVLRGNHQRRAMLSGL